jgi:hypothetical protein
MLSYYLKKATNYSTFFTTQETIILKEYRNVDNYFNVFPPYDFPSVTFYCLSFRFKGSVGLITCLEEYL